jgi:hypothetical protein
VRTVSAVAGASIFRHESARVSEPAWNSTAGQRVHLERRRVDEPLEAIGRDVVAATDGGPVVGVAVGEPQDRAAT